MPAGPEDRHVVDSYDGWPDKGDPAGGRRATIMTARQRYAVDEEVRVIHVVEALEPDLDLYIMGPKEVFDEYVDGRLATRPLREGADPFVPDTYDGATLPGPGVDANYEVTSYRFGQPGTHTIVWQPGDVRSNALAIEVT